MGRFRNVRLLLAGITSALLLSGLAPAAASSANLSHSYHSDTTITKGSIVSLDSSRSNFVDAANTSNGARVVGVAVASNDSLLAVDPGKDLTQVATSGTADTLVSTVNGDIKVGDKIAVSPFNGVGMKSGPGDHVIGLAQTAFSSSSNGATSMQVTDKNGKQSSIQIGFIRLNIAVGTDTTESGNAQLSSLQRFAKALTGHTISTARIVVALVIAVVAFVSLVVLIYASIYGSIISIGRNPLAKFAVFRTLGSVLGMAALTAIVATVTIFLLLH